MANDTLPLNCGVVVIPDSSTLPSEFKTFAARESTQSGAMQYSLYPYTLHVQPTNML